MAELPARCEGLFSIASPSLRLAAFALKIHNRMAGKFLPFARIGEKAINVVSTRGGQFVFDAPDFAQDKIAFGRLNRIAF